MPSGIGAAGSGLELTAEQVVSMLVEPLMAQSVFLSAGPRMFTSAGGAPIRVPTIKVYDLGGTGASAGGGASATYWHGENELITEEDPEYDEVTMLPATLKSVKVLHRFSSELARLAVVNIANALRDAIVRRMSLALDRAFLIGDGTGNTILGIARTPGILQPSPYGAPVEVDNLHDAVGESLAADASPSTWFMHPDAFTALRKQREGTGTGQYLLQPDPAEGNRFTLLGLPVRVTTQLDSGEILLVDMSQVAAARDVDMSVKLLDQTYGDYDQLALRVVSRWDVALLNPEGVVRMVAA